MATAATGPIAKPKCPPKEKMDTRKPLPFPSDTRPASDTAGGWKKALPSPPNASSAASTAKLGASPMRLRKMPETIGPSATSHRRPTRSAKYPMTGCGSDEASERTMASTAARAMDKPSFSMRRGRSGCRKAT